MRIKMPMTKRDKDMQLEGFFVGVLASLAVLNDVYDFTDEELQDVAEKDIVFMESLADGNEDYKRIKRQLERQIGIKLEAKD